MSARAPDDPGVPAGSSGPSRTLPTGGNARAALITTPVAALLVTVAVLALVRAGALEGPELALYDRQLGASIEPARADSPVLLVVISERDIREQGHWPVSDRTLAEALARIASAGARVIGLDIYRDLPVSPGSDALDRMLREEPRIVAVRNFGTRDEDRIPGPPALAGSQRVGFNDLLPDEDDVVRRWLLYQDDGRGEVEPSFALLVALRALAAEGVSLGPDPHPSHPDWLRLGPTTIRPLTGWDGGYAGVDDRGYQMLLDYAAAGSGLERVRLGELLRGEVEAGRLRDRVVLLGSSAESVGDFFPAAVSGETLAGVELHGLAVDQLIRFGRGQASPRRAWSPGLEGLLVGVAALLGCALGLGLPGRPALSVPSLFAAVLLGLLALWLAATVVFRSGGWMPVASPGLAWVGAVGVVTTWVSSRERAAREQLMQIFSRAVSPSVAAEIWRRRAEIFDEGRLRPQRLVATVVFADLRGYTARSEKMDPVRLMEWSNAFMELLADHIRNFGGVVDDYFGDGIKADFGVPIPRLHESEIAEDARNAVACAMALARSLPELNRRCRARGLPECHVKVGIHTGPVVAVGVGSTDRFKYTVVGHVPVAAQRLESTTEVAHDFDASPCRILVSDQTARHLGDAFPLAPVGSLALRGREEPLQVYRVQTPEGV